MVSKQVTSPTRPSVDAVLGPLGAAIMRVLWSADEAPLATVVERVGRGERRPAYTTVTTILSRLRERGLVERRRQGRTAVYRALVSEDELVVTSSEQAVDSVLTRFGDTAFRHFATRLGAIDPDLRREVMELARRHRPTGDASGE